MPQGAGNRKFTASGTLRVVADVNGNLTAAPRATSALAPAVNSSAFLLTGVNADVDARGLTYEGQNYGNLTAAAQTTGQISASMRIPTLRAPLSA